MLSTRLVSHVTTRLVSIKLRKVGVEPDARIVPVRIEALRRALLSSVGECSALAALGSTEVRG